jgi:NAD(P)-dependent dehydrogenase (short-subunit alcohol dehydrogenase family)
MDTTSAIKAACITGCSSGFGRITARHLSRSGWNVFATVRSQEDQNDLAAQAVKEGADDRLHAVICDITKATDVASLAQEIGNSVGQLDALINNAGTAFPCPLELLTTAALQKQLEINVVAHLSVIRALLPLLKKARGTIINVSSLQGKIALPGLGAYGMSKFALEAMSDTLRIELAPFGIHVVVVEPDSSQTKIWETSTERGLAMIDRQNLTGYEQLMRAAQKRLAQLAARGFPPALFAQTVATILASPSPRARYCIPTKAAWKLLARRFLPDRLWDRLILRSLQSQ